MSGKKKERKDPISTTSPTETRTLKFNAKSKVRNCLLEMHYIKNSKRPEFQVQDIQNDLFFSLPIKAALLIEIDLDKLDCWDEIQQGQVPGLALWPQ